MSEEIGLDREVSVSSLSTGSRGESELALESSTTAWLVTGSEICEEGVGSEVDAVVRGLLGLS